MRSIQSLLLLSLVACGQNPSLNTDLKATEIDFSIRVPRETEGTFGIKIKYEASNNHLPSIVHKVATVTQVSGDTYEMKEWHCRADLGHDAKQNMALSEASLKAISPVTFPVRAWKDAEEQIYLTSQNITQSIGSRSALPAGAFDANDSRLLDVEKDGFPGMTATITGLAGIGKIYFAQTTTFKYDLYRDSEATFFGTVEETSIVSVLNPTQLALGHETLTDLSKPITRKGTVEMLRFEDGPDCTDMPWDTTFRK